MRFFLFIIFLFLFSCSNKVTQVYICGDHPCVNKKERKEYFDNNISIEVFTIIPDKKNKKKFTLVDLNLMKDDGNKDRKKGKDLSSVKSKEDVKKIIKKRRKLAKLKLKENKVNFFLFSLSETIVKTSIDILLSKYSFLSFLLTQG